MPQTSPVPLPPASKSRGCGPPSRVDARFAGGVSAVGRTEALLDRQLGLLTEALAERLALARPHAGSDPKRAFASREELDKALLVVAASADLVRAKARLRGEMQLRYHVVRLEGPEAARFAGADDRPAGACGLRAAHRRAEAVLADLVPPPPLPSLAEIAEAFEEDAEVLDDAEDSDATPDDPVDGPEPEFPHLTLEEMMSTEGYARYLARWDVAKRAHTAWAAAQPVNRASAGEAIPPPRDYLAGGGSGRTRTDDKKS